MVDNNTAKPCKCREGRIYKSILKSSGISEAFQKMTFGTYTPKNTAQAIAKKTAIEYVQSFETIKGERQNGIMFTCQVGAGKTHLSVAILNNLMKKNIGVVYMPYKEAINYMKQIKNDEESYQKEMHKYKNAPVLMIDDLFKLSERKGNINEADIDIVYEIVNARYIKSMPIIVSTEYDVDKLMETDQATGSRIIEMCKGRIIEFQGKELNHRLI
jgi:DNA replication protein DnaC